MNLLNKDNPPETPKDDPKDESLLDKAVEEVQKIVKPIATFTSHPIRNLRLGLHQFENSTLHFFEQEALDEFEKMLGDQPPQIKSQIKKIDVAAAESIAKEFLGSMTRGIETSGTGLKTGQTGSSR